MCKHLIYGANEECALDDVYMSSKSFMGLSWIVFLLYREMMLVHSEY